MLTHSHCTSNLGKTKFESHLQQSLDHRFPPLISSASSPFETKVNLLPFCTLESTETLIELKFDLLFIGSRKVDSLDLS